MGVSDRCEMTWQADKSRWRKMHKGTLYFIRCKELGCPPTKEGSYRAANSWWKAKRAELDAHIPAHPHAAHIAECLRRQDYSLRHDDGPAVANFYGWLAKKMRENPDGPSLLKAGQVLLSRIAEWGSNLPGDPTAEDEGEDLDSPIPDLLLDIEGAKWAGIFAREEADLPPENRTVGFHLSKYVEMERGRIQEGLSHSQFRQTELCLKNFQAWTGPEAAIDVIDAQRWEAYFLYLRDWPKSVEYKKKCLYHARQFITWLADIDLIQLPRNLNRKQYRFESAPKVVVPMPLEEVRLLVENAKGQHKLHFLLMINTGMLQKDISDLKPSEVDWEDGRITRKRSKTKNVARVPTVSYKLWPETFSLLQKYGNRDGLRVLLTENSNPWVVERFNGQGKSVKTDNIRSHYVRLQKKLGIQTALKGVRKTSSSMLREDPRFSSYVDYFLGQTPKTVAERHYAPLSPQIFDQAVLWIGQQYGYISQDA